MTFSAMQSGHAFKFMVFPRWASFKLVEDLADA
jgi:hypothetical protein